MNLRSFLYLDEYKLYSFSSQVFSGLTEHVVHTSERSRENDAKRTLTSSATVVAEIASERSGTQERRFLHDYAYTLFEAALREQALLYSADASSSLSDFASARFVCVSGRATLLDTERLGKMVDKINELGESIVYSKMYQEIAEKREQLQGQLQDAKDKNQRARIGQELTQLKDVRRLAKEAGFAHDDEIIKRVSFLLDYGFEKTFQVRIPVDTPDGLLVFSGILKREALRESAHSIGHKYARQTDRPITMVGIVTQAGTSSTVQRGGINSVKEGVVNLVANMGEIEAQFAGCGENEIIVDPIAVYLDVGAG